MSAVLKGVAQSALQNIAFVPMQAEDLDAILILEERIYAFPWSRGNFTDSLSAGYSAWVCHAAGGMAGYAIIMMVVDEAHLLNISIRSELQRQGLGTMFLEHLCAVARGHGAVRMFLEVRASNRSGRALYARYSFAQIGRRRGYYAGHSGREDAIVMKMEL